uniref:Uncharacterized protein n=1 Tax=Oryza glumipatula TaxID=40148 RepID=A0A0E0B9I3_9ORYZ
MHPQGLSPPICPKQAKVQQNHEYKLRKNASIYNCHSGTLSLREFHERYWSPDFKIGRSFRGCHFNCRCVHSLAM